MTLSTRIGLMNHGEIVQTGTPSEMYEYPTSRFVAEFIGSVNTFEGKLSEDEPSYVRIECADLEAPIYVNHGVSSAPGATVWAALQLARRQEFFGKTIVTIGASCGERYLSTALADRARADVSV